MIIVLVISYGFNFYCGTIILNELNENLKRFKQFLNIKKKTSEILWMSSSNNIFYQIAILLKYNTIQFTIKPEMIIFFESWQMLIVSFSYTFNSCSKFILTKYNSNYFIFLIKFEWNLNAESSEKLIAYFQHREKNFIPGMGFHIGVILAILLRYYSYCVD